MWTYVYSTYNNKYKSINIYILDNINSLEMS